MAKRSDARIFDENEQRARDETLRRLLKTPPQPRPKREREKPKRKKKTPAE